ncbi:MAG TPA: hypothetical protein VES20_04045 [Bryobacteraceae bacterium]|nr:hypothetical protein [Bryobacteraceae bacterium]
MRLLVVLTLAVSCLADVTHPLVGWICDRAGSLRPVYGTAGAFVLGEAVSHNISTASFNGTRGFALKGGTRFHFDREGRLEENESAAEQSVAARFNGSTLILESTAARIEFPQPIERIHAMGEGWLAVRTADAVYAVSTSEGTEQSYQLPEAEQ